MSLRPPALWRHPDLSDHLPRMLYRLCCIQHTGVPVLANSRLQAMEWLATHDPQVCTMDLSTAREYVCTWIQERRESETTWRWVS